MRPSEMVEILDYIDAEFPNSAKTQDEKEIRAKHWFRELGSYDFTQVFMAVKRVSESGFAPRTAQIISELKKRNQTVPCGSKGSFRIIKNGDDPIYELKFAHGGGGSGRVFGLIDAFALLQLRYVAEQSEEAKNDFDTVLYAYDHGKNYMAIAENILRRICGMPEYA